MAFQGFLRADTEVDVVIGPVVAIADGITPVTGLDLSTADEAEIMKHDASAVTDISGGTMSAISNMDGYYNLTMPAGYLDTEGMLTVGINDDSLCLPVRATFMVMNANAYDSMYAAAGTDYLQTDTLQIGGVTQSATDLKDFADTGYDPTAHKVQGVVLTDTCTTLTGHTAQTGDNYARLGAPVGASISADIASNKTELDGLQGTDGKCVISTDAQDLSGSLDVNTKTITAGAVNAAAIATDAIDADALAADALAEINAECDTALSDYDPPTKAEMDSAHSTTDGLITTVDGVVDAIKLVTDNLPDSGALTDIDTGINNIEAKLPTNYIMGSSDQTDQDDDIAAILEDTGTTIPGTLSTIEGKIDTVDTVVDGIQTDLDNGTDGLGALKDLVDTLDAVADTIAAKLPSKSYLAGSADSDGGIDSTEAAVINGEIADVIRTDTIAEMSQGAPPATPTLEQAINYLYRKLRNKTETTGSEDAVYDDAGSTKLFKSALSDDGSTFTKAEYGSGA